MKSFVAGLLAVSIVSPAITRAAEPAPTPVAQPNSPAATVEVTPAAKPQTVAVLEPVAAQNILRASTEVPLVTREELTTKKKQLRVGQRVQLEVASNVEMNGVTVIPVGTPAVAELTEVRNKGMWGKSGYIGARILSLRLGDRQIRLSGTFDDKGITGTAGVVGAVAFVPIAGFFTTGTSARIPTGSAVKGFLEEDIVFRTVEVQPQVLEVPVAPPATVAPPVSAATSTPAAATATQPTPPPAAPATH
ncbi:MAG: hypothetical protein ABL996_25575 [Micropepsaceae bacterium]